MSSLRMRGAIPPLSNMPSYRTKRQLYIMCVLPRFSLRLSNTHRMSAQQADTNENTLKETESLYTACL
jgi:hypothetical protein